MSFDSSLRHHLINLNTLAESKVYQALIVDEDTDKNTYLPSLVFELENEERNVKVNRVNAVYHITSVASTLSDATSIVDDVYDSLADFDGKLNDEFPCTMEFVELQRRYINDLKYWIVYTKYNVSYNYIN